MVTSLMVPMVGASFTAVTVTLTGSLSLLPAPSEATRLICVVPLRSGAGVTDSVQVPAGPGTSETPAAGIRVVLPEVAIKLRLPACVSASVTVMLTVPLGVSSNVVIGPEIVITGGSTGVGVTLTTNASVARVGSPSLTVTVIVAAPDSVATGVIA